MKKTNAERAGLIGKVKSVKTILYDDVTEESGEIAKEKFHDIDEYIYDVNGYLIERLIFHWECGSGRPFGKTTYLYDSNGNLIEKIYYDFMEKITNRLTYQYDSYGNLIEEKMYSYIDDPNGVLLYTNTCEYKYDSNGNWIEQKQYTEQKPDFVRRPVGITERTITYHE